MCLLYTLRLFKVLKSFLFWRDHGTVKIFSNYTISTLIGWGSKPSKLVSLSYMGQFVCHFDACQFQSLTNRPKYRQITVLSCSERKQPIPEWSCWWVIQLVSNAFENLESKFTEDLMEKELHREWNRTNSSSHWQHRNIIL